MMSPGPRFFLFDSVHSSCSFTARFHVFSLEVAALTPDLDCLSVKSNGKEEEILGSSSILLILSHTNS